MTKKLLVAVLILGWCFSNRLFAQKEKNIWYFGYNAGLDFNSGTPLALTNSSMDQLEGCSSIADANGNILFYTDGVQVWDRNHNQMPNGFGLAGGYSATQSALIVPFVGNPFQFYIFTVEANFSGTNHFNYSVVDMTLNAGNGDVTIKNNLIMSSIAEKLTAVKHANNSDVWVMVHGYNDNNLFAYLVTAAGISSLPVTSIIGSVIPSSDLGYMKFSADGTKIAFAETYPNYVELFDFNPSTGSVTNVKHLLLPGYGAYGIEFSPSGNYLYCTQASAQNIYQWNISSNSDSIINSTLQQIGTTTALESSALQLGPDGRIYIALYHEQFLGVINYPDSVGLACNYVDIAISLGGRLSNLGLPNFITGYFLATGISNFEFSAASAGFQFSPNPATDKIYISFPATASENIIVKIYSITGEVVFAEENKSTVPISNCQIPILNISNGIYFLSVQTGREMMTRKIVVNH